MANSKTTDRVAQLEAARALKMARSAHAYVRGNTAKFYEWLAASAVAKTVPVGPAIWICGDCHLGNLGPIADGDGSIEVLVRDLDQTVIGNPAYDLIRLGLSLATAARGSDLSGVTTARMVEQMIDGYAHALVEPKEDDAGPEPAVVRAVKRRAMGRRWRHLARDRIDGPKPTISLGRKFWKISAKERGALDALFSDPDIQRQILSLDPRDEDRDIRLVDAAYWVKGCSSLGLLRYAALLGIDGVKGRADLALVDLKEAVASVAPARKNAGTPTDSAERVVTGARAMSPQLGDRMIATRLLGKSMFIRELAPQDLKIDVEQFSHAQAIKAARYLAYIVGKAHARQMSRSQRAAWRKTLLDYGTGDFDAPSWLWNAIVDLAAAHEAGYLDHCRRFALVSEPR